MPTTENFSTLTADDATYLLNLINDIDLDTAYTARQRGYTIPKLEEIARGQERRVAYQDVLYLIELIEDDDAPELEQQRIMTLTVLQSIRDLIEARQEENRNIEDQRAARRSRRSGSAPIVDGAEKLSAHFEHTRG